jgi:hypothetical protein
MPSSLGDLAKRLAGAGSGGPATPAAPERRGLTDLSRRVLGRWGALPVKALAVFTGWTTSIPAEDAELLGECSVDLVGTVAIAPDPQTEAIARWFVAHGAVVAEGFLAAAEKRLEKERAEKKDAP